MFGSAEREEKINKSIQYEFYTIITENYHINP